MNCRVLLIGGSPIHEYRGSYYVPHNYARHLEGLSELCRGIDFYAQVLDSDALPSGIVPSSKIRIVPNRFFSRRGRKSLQDFMSDQYQICRIAKGCVGCVESFPASGGILSPIHIFPPNIKRIVYLNTDVRARMAHRATFAGGESLAHHIKVLYLGWSQDYLVRLADAVLVRGRALLKQYERSARHIEIARPIASFSADYAFQRQDTCQDVEVRILFVGHLAHHKRVLDLVRAVALASRNLFGQRALRLTLVGGEHPTEEERISVDEIYIEADRAGIRQCVECAGRIDDAQELASLYRTADIFVLPSAFEGFPRVLDEALLYSLPVITTPVGGIPGELRDGEQALFVPVGDPEGIASAIIRILNTPSLRQTLIREGYRWAVSQESETSWQQYARLLGLVR